MAGDYTTLEEAMEDLGREYLAVTVAEFEAWRRASEKALGQVPDAALHTALGEGENTLAVLLRHVGNNLRSRFTDFLTTDGEKPDRDREGEFAPTAASRAELMSVWDDGWERLFSTLRSLEPGDLSRTVLVRSEPHTVVRALQRALAHAASHAGPIVLLSKHLAGPAWASITIPRGESDAFNARMRAKFGGP
jgi:hypothetical protein